jgi:FkbM family methyltransferase
VGIQRLLLKARQHRRLKVVDPWTTVHIASGVMSLDLTNLTDFAMFEQLVDRNGYEPGTTSLLLKILESDSVFVDIGANSGYFSIVALERIRPPGQIYSIEPNPNSFRRLVSNLGRNQLGSMVKAIQVAVTDSFGEGNLAFLDEGDGSATLVVGSSTQTVVRTAPLDSMIPDKHVDVLKFDAEGSELAVLKGLDEIYVRSPKLQIIMEWNSAYASKCLWDYASERFELYRIWESPVEPKITRLSSFDDVRWLNVCNLYGTSKNRAGPNFP